MSKSNQTALVVQGREVGAEAGLLADIGEGAVPVVVVKDGTAVGGDEDVGKAVVIVVADGHAHAESAARHARRFGHIREGAVAIVLVERVANGLWACRNRWGRC